MRASMNTRGSISCKQNTHDTHGTERGRERGQTRGDGNEGRRRVGCLERGSGRQDTSGEQKGKVARDIAQEGTQLLLQAGKDILQRWNTHAGTGGATTSTRQTAPRHDTSSRGCIPRGKGYLELFIGGGDDEGIQHRVHELLLGQQLASRLGCRLLALGVGGKGGLVLLPPSLLSLGQPAGVVRGMCVASCERHWRGERRGGGGCVPSGDSFGVELGVEHEHHAHLQDT
jgi:hypothetical protein